MSDENPLATFRGNALYSLASIESEWSRGILTLSDEDLDRLSAEVDLLETESREVGYSDVALMCRKLGDLLSVAQFKQEEVAHGIETLGSLAINFAVMLVRSREQSTPGLDLPNFAAEIDSAVQEAQRLFRQASKEEHATSTEPEAVQPAELAGRYDQLAVAATDLYLEALALEPERRDRLIRRWDELIEALRDLEVVPMQRRLDRYRVVAQEAADRAGNQVDLRADLQHLVLPPDHAKLMDLVLTELIENAIEHGIERHRARTVVGKQPWGVVTLWARREGDEVVVEVQDDGRGIDVRELRRRFPDVAEDALLEQASSAEFSTRPKSRAGARGQGLARVEEAITALGGTFALRSTISAGSTVVVRLPAIEPVVEVWTFSCGDARYAVPADCEVQFGEGSGVHPLSLCGVPTGEPRDGPVLHVTTRQGEEMALQSDDEPRRGTLMVRCQTPGWHPANILTERGKPVVFIRRCGEL